MQKFEIVDFGVILKAVFLEHSKKISSCFPRWAGAGWVVFEKMNEIKRNTPRAPDLSAWKSVHRHGPGPGKILQGKWNRFKSLDVNVHKVLLHENTDNLQE